MLRTVEQAKNFTSSQLEKLDASDLSLSILPPQLSKLKLLCFHYVFINGDIQRTVNQ